MAAVEKQMVRKVNSKQNIICHAKIPPTALDQSNGLGDTAAAETSPSAAWPPARH
ncbi:hypothetical protein Vi05172_g2819 [Venturia inaequalis]|nr:hypothetical protein Vi05172_g2819 [Venturia inaequalis]